MELWNATSQALAEINQTMNAGKRGPLRAHGSRQEFASRAYNAWSDFKRAKISWTAYPFCPVYGFNNSVQNRHGFQHFELYPHMTAWKHHPGADRVLKKSKKDAETKAMELLERVKYRTGP